MTKDRIIEIVKNWVEDHYVSVLDESLEDLSNRLKFADALENGKRTF